MLEYVATLSILALLFFFAAIFLLKRCQYLYNKNVELTDKYEALIIKEQKTSSEKKNTFIHLSKQTLMLANNTLVLDEVLSIIGNPYKDARSSIEQYIRRGKSAKSDFLDGIRDVAEYKAPGAIKSIKRVYPTLTEDEIDLYCMTYIGTSVNTICFVLDCTPASMYNKKSVLRKKLEITDSKFSLKKHFEQVVYIHNKSLGFRIR